MPHKPIHHRHHKKTPLISIQMVSKTYGEDPLDFKTLVIKNVYLDIFEGEFVIIFGPSGSGKSTILNLLAGLENPTAGRVLIRRRDLSKFNSEELAQYHRRKMGFVFQNFNLIKSLNVWENVALPQTANGVRFAERQKKALKLLKLLNIDHYAHRHPNELSGGEQQRVAIARALVNDPYFLLVDEPTGNLDSKSAEDVMSILHDIHAKDKHTIVLVTHNPNQLRYATRVVYMEDGKIVIEENRDDSSEAAKTPAFSHLTPSPANKDSSGKVKPSTVHPLATPVVTPTAKSTLLVTKEEMSSESKPGTPAATPQVAPAPETKGPDTTPSVAENKPAAPDQASPSTPEVVAPAAPEILNTDVITTVITKDES